MSAASHERTRSARRPTRWEHSVALALAIAIASSPLSSCVAVLDGAVYRERPRDVVAVDRADERRTDDVSVDRDVAASDARDTTTADDVTTLDAPPTDVAPDVTAGDTVDALDAGPPRDVFDASDARDPSPDAPGDARIDTSLPIDVTGDVVVELDATFTDGGLIDVILPDIVPDIPCPPCGIGQSCCAGVCVNMSINEQNCGGCGVVCPAPGICQSGACGSCTLGLVCGGAQQRCCVAGLLCLGILCP